MRFCQQGSAGQAQKHQQQAVEAQQVVKGHAMTTPNDFSQADDALFFGFRPQLPQALEVDESHAQTLKTTR